MGFHKRWINIESLKIRFKDGGIEEVRSYLDSPDAIIITDDESAEILRIFQNGGTDKELIEKINTYICI